MRNSIIVLIAACLAGCAASAQTFEAMATPQPEAVLASLRITQLGVWSIRVYNSGSTQPTFPPELLLMQFPTVHWVDSGVALSVLTAAQAASPSQRVAQIITIGTGVAGVFGGSGIVAMSKSILGDLAAGSLTANYIAGQLKTLAPNISAFTGNLCNVPVSLAPGAALTCTMFADPTDAATPSISTGATTMMAMGQAQVQATAVPKTIYRKHGILGLGTKTLIVVHPPIHVAFQVRQ